MKWVGDLGLELYVASQTHPDRKQYIESSQVLEFIRKNRLDGWLVIHSLDDIAKEGSLNTLKVNQKEEARLPYLLCGYGCETGAFLGYFGVEEVLDMLNDHLLRPSIR